MTKDSPRTSVLRDEELIARLRDAKRDWPEFGHDRAEAADRIDTCAAEREKLEAAEAKLAECEARLRKAVEAMRRCRVWVENAANGDHPFPELAADDLRTLDAALKGESHD